MIGKTNVGGGGGNAFAYIGAVYPVGSTCTCTNGVRSYTAKGTGGLYVFNIPYADDWTVTATDGTNTVSKTVTITNQWQDVLAELTYYDGTIFDNGNQFVSVTGGWAYNPNANFYLLQSYNSSTIDTTIKIEPPNGSRSCIVQTLNMVDFTGMVSLSVDIESLTTGVSTTTSAVYLSVSKRNSGRLDDSNSPLRLSARNTISSPTTITADFSNYPSFNPSDSYYVAVGASYTNGSLEVSKIKLNYA